MSEDIAKRDLTQDTTMRNIIYVDSLDPIYIDHKTIVTRVLGQYDNRVLRCVIIRTLYPFCAREENIEAE